MAQQIEPGQSAASHAAPSPFEALLRQLQDAHAAEVQELRDENAALRARARLGDEGCAAPPAEDEEAAPQPGLDPEVAAPQPGLDPEVAAAQPRPEPPELDDNPIRWVWDAEELKSPSKSSASTLRTIGVSKMPSTGTRVARYRSVSTMAGATGEKSTGGWMRRQRVPKVFEDIAPRTIDLQMLCVQKYPDEQWVNLSLKGKVELLREALRPRHNLINPYSPFMRWWDLIVATSIVQVGLSTPFEVVFVGNQTFWTLFTVSRLVDLIFAVDIAIQFFLVVEVRRSRWGGTVMLRDPWILRKRYLTSWFLIDVVSIIPFDVASMVLRYPIVQQAKLIRGIKLLRLAKLLRMLRSSRIIQRWRNGIGTAFAVQKLVQFIVVLMLVSHWIACLWGFTGLMLGSDLCDEQGRAAGANPGVDQVSWVTTLYLGGKNSPDSPCDPFTVYSASLHWAVMTLTSIGYGDIVPVRLEEYLVCIACMLLGGVLWAYIIGSLCSIISNRSLLQHKFEADTDLLNFAMREACVPRVERPKYREYLREAVAYHRRVRFAKVAASLSPLLRQELMFHVSRHALRSVSYFGDAEVPRNLLTEIAPRLVLKFFSRGECLDSLRHDLCMVDRGTVAHNQRILVPPSVLHEDFIILRKFKRPAASTSLTYTQVLVLTKNLLEDLLPEYPDFSDKLKVCAVKMAFCFAMLTIRETYSQLLASKGSDSELSLKEAFDAAFGERAKTSLPRCISPKSSRHNLVQQLRDVRAASAPAQRLSC